MVERLPASLLRLEGATVAAAAVALYFHLDGPWWLLLLLALAPDLSFIGYAAGPRVGAVVYDTAHTSVVPVALATVGALTGSDSAVHVGLIWLVHIGVDRTIGYGLKYPSGFKDTHLQRV